jgi:predicted ATPase
LKNDFSQKNSEISLKFESGDVFNLIFKEHQLMVTDIEFKTKISIINFKTNPNEPIYYLEQLDDHIKIYGNIKKDSFHLIEQINRLLLTKTFGSLKKHYDKLYFLPASRSGLYGVLNAFGGVFAELSHHHSIIGSKMSLTSIPEPLSDYFLNLSSIRTLPKENDFGEIAQLFEDKLLRGKVIFDEERKKIYYHPKYTKIQLELSNTSSMIAELAPFVAHLKYVISTTKISNILFIEEPEAHLHPKIQVELMKIFALLAQKGLKIVLTSHSNYLFNKLSNMILAKEIDPATIRVAHMKLGEMGSYVDENSMQVDQDGIDDDNFSETAEALYLERMKLYKQNH